MERGRNKAGAVKVRLPAQFVVVTGQRYRVRNLGWLRYRTAQRSYDPGMSVRKTRVTISVDPHLAAYAERLVEAGRAPSVSAVFSAAMEQKILRDRRGLGLLKARAAEADPDKVARMRAHVDAQLAELG